MRWRPSQRPCRWLLFKRVNKLVDTPTMFDDCCSLHDNDGNSGTGVRLVSLKPTFVTGQSRSSVCFMSSDLHVLLLGNRMCFCELERTGQLRYLFTWTITLNVRWV